MAAPTPAPVFPADTGVWHIADTLHRVSAAAAPADLPRLVVRFQAGRLASLGDSRPRLAHARVDSLGWGRECGFHRIERLRGPEELGALDQGLEQRAGLGRREDTCGRNEAPDLP